MYKKIVLFVISFMYAVNFNIAFAEQTPEIIEGTYIQVGKYMGENIIWRCIDTDTNGKLILSDKILCYKDFDAMYHKGVKVNSEFDGCGFWEESTLRAWLNATCNGGDIVWPGQNPPTKERAYHDYDQEDGFLSLKNFSSSELKVMKTVGQWQILGIGDAGLATNGISFAFGYNYYPGRAYWSGKCGYKTISELSHIEGAMYRLNDTVFLLNELQIYEMWRNFGTIRADATECAASQRTSYPEDNTYWWLRTGEGSIANVVYGDNNYSTGVCHSVISKGVRPAFYLNDRATIIKSGNGTKEDPYIVDGQVGDEIAVFSNGQQVNFDVEPLIENDRTLVGMRAIFEALGSKVEWEQDTATAMAVNGNTKIQLQVNNDIMLVNDTRVQIDAPARIIENRTMVPLRAISEALDADVEWIEGLRRVVIDKPETMVFDDNVGKENWQTGIFGDWKPDISKHDGGYSEYLKAKE